MAAPSDRSVREMVQWESPLPIPPKNLLWQKVTAGRANRDRCHSPIRLFWSLCVRRDGNTKTKRLSHTQGQKIRRTERDRQIFQPTSLKGAVTDKIKHAKTFLVRVHSKQKRVNTVKEFYWTRHLSTYKVQRCQKLVRQYSGKPRLDMNTQRFIVLWMTATL